jgi:hypothetical protein
MKSEIWTLNEIRTNNEWVVSEVDLRNGVITLWKPDEETEDTLFGYVFVRLSSRKWELSAIHEADVTEKDSLKFVQWAELEGQRQKEAMA